MKAFLLLCSLLILHEAAWAEEFQPGAAARSNTLRYVPAPADNPLKGLVPYVGEKRQLFPHSMEFNYLPLSDLMTGYQEFNWQPLEKLLDEIAGRRHQAVFRIWMEYPGRDEGIPKFLEDDGLKVTKWTYTETQPLPPARVRTPDYANPQLRRALKRFIAALGKRYDGDPRIGFITAGLLGVWGEWHNYPRSELMAQKDVQTEVMDAYEQAFLKTPILLRYPAGPENFRYADNSARQLGYHDDSFAWATLDTGKAEDNWFFVPAMKAAGKDVSNRWKVQPIGGEIRPELWGQVFDDPFDPSPQQGQCFEECVRITHVSWLMDTGMFRKQQPPKRIKNATLAVQKMGYEFHIVAASLQQTDATSTLRLKVKNTGVAPFYYDWPVEVASLARSKGEISNPDTVTKAEWSLTNLLPGEVRDWEIVLSPRTSVEIAVRVVNPLPNGVPLKFANEEARQLGSGWLRVTP